jgi:hypothetical protein
MSKPGDLPPTTQGNWLQAELNRVYAERAEINKNRGTYLLVEVDNGWVIERNGKPVRVVTGDLAAVGKELIAMHTVKVMKQVDDTEKPDLSDVFAP